MNQPKPIASGGVDLLLHELLCEENTLAPESQCAQTSSLSKRIPLSTDEIAASARRYGAKLPHRETSEVPITSRSRQAHDAMESFASNALSNALCNAVLFVLDNCKRCTTSAIWR